MTPEPEPEPVFPSYEPEPEPVAQTFPTYEPEPVPEPEPVAEVTPEPEPVFQPEPEPEPVNEPQTVAEVFAAYEAGGRHEPQTVAELFAAYETAYEPAHRAEPEPVAEVFPTHEPEPEPAAHREPEPEPEDDEPYVPPVIHGPAGPGSMYAPIDGSVPKNYPIKGQASTMLYFPKGAKFYSHVVADVYFDTAEAAEHAGFTRWDRRATTAHVIRPNAEE